MFQFVYWLKAIAAIFITNAHYEGIWPIPAMAFGGHLGNCLYFFVSGFCLYRIRESFPKWYLKRAIRIYSSFWIIIGFLFLVGYYRYSTPIALFHCLVYPTWFHFIGTIMLLYPLLYLLRWIQSKLPLKTWMVMLAVLILFLAKYIFCFDKTYYHIDDANEKWVRFQFAQAMLMGLLFREKYDSMDQKITWFDWLSVATMFVMYLASKMAFSRIAAWSMFQCIHPMVLLLLIYRIAVLFIKMEKAGVFERLSKWDRPVRFVSAITLEIYLVQFAIIGKLNGLPFPRSFLAATTLILLSAWLAHMLANWAQKKISWWLHL